MRQRITWLTLSLYDQRIDREVLRDVVDVVWIPPAGAQVPERDVIEFVRMHTTNLPVRQSLLCHRLSGGNGVRSTRVENVVVPHHQLISHGIKTDGCRRNVPGALFDDMPGDFCVERYVLQERNEVP